MTTPGARSSVAPADWLPLQERLVDGVAHALNNRVASLMGVTQLFEMKLATLEATTEALSAEVERIRHATLLLRPLGSATGEEREPVRARDALALATSLLAQDRVARDHQFEVEDESAEVPPLLLWRADHLRIGVLMLLAATADATGPASVRISITAAAGMVRIRALSPCTLSAVRAAPSFAALGRFAQEEGGQCSSAAAPHGATALELSLPGLDSASARGEP